MKTQIWICLFFLTSPLLMEAQIIIPDTDTDSLQFEKIEMSIDEESGDYSIKTVSQNALSKYIVREWYSGNINDLDTVFLAVDKKETICQLRFYSCNDEKLIKHRMIKLDSFWNKEKQINRLWLGNWNYQLHGQELQALVDDWNKKWITKPAACQSKFKTQLISAMKGGWTANDERGITEELVDTMPSFQGSYNIKSRDSIIQAYCTECLSRDTNDYSGVAILRFTVLKDGRIGYFNYPYLEDRGMKAPLENCLKQMGKWSPGKNRFGDRQVEINTLIGINVPDVAARINELLDISTQSKIGTKKVERKPVVISDALFGEIFSNEEPDDEEVFVVVEQSPEFPGGYKAAEEFEKEIQKQAKKEFKKLSGSFVIRFIVEPDGSLSDFAVLRTPDHALNPWMIEKYKELPNWTPGKQRGKPVRVQQQMRLNF